VTILQELQAVANPDSMICQVENRTRSQNACARGLSKRVEPRLVCAADRGGLLQGDQLGRGGGCEPRAVPDHVLDELFGELDCHRDRASLDMFLSSGARAAERLGVTVSDAHPRGGQIIVRSKGLGGVKQPCPTEAFAWLARYVGERRRRIATGPAEVTAWWANDFDLLLTPAAGEPPAILDELLPPAEDPLSILPRFERIWCFTAPFSVNGQLAISLPIGQTAGGLPVGVQLVAAIGRDDLLLHVAAQLETAARWSDRRPPLTT
jgi:hypothetical protein